MIDLSIIIVSFNTKMLTLKCLESIFEKKWQNKLEVIIIDNFSTDETVKEIKNLYPKVKIIQNNSNLGFATANNQGLKVAEGEYCLLLNSDTEIKDGSLDNLINFAREKNFQVASCKLSNPDGTIQPNGGALPFIFPLLSWITGVDDLFKKIGFINSYHQMEPNFYQNEKQLGWVAGTAMLIKKDILKKVGFLDENLFMYVEDVEFCWRVSRGGFKVGFTDKAEIVHLGGGSSQNPKYAQWLGEFKGLLYIYKKYYGILAALILRFLIYIFTILRMIVFVLLGKINYSKTYAKVIINL